MDITKQDIGKEFYFVDRCIGGESYVIEYGEITSILPKYNFQDSFGTKFKREENILFKTLLPNGEEKMKSVSNPNLIFETISSAISYCKLENVVFGASVVYNKKRRYDNDGTV